MADVFDQDTDDADAAYGPAAEHCVVFALAGSGLYVEGYAIETYLGQK